MDTYPKGNYLFGINGAETISFLHNHQEDMMSDEYMQYFNKVCIGSNVSEIIIFPSTFLLFLTF